MKNYIVVLFFAIFATQIASAQSYNFNAPTFDGIDFNDSNQVFIQHGYRGFYQVPMPKGVTIGGVYKGYERYNFNQDYKMAAFHDTTDAYVSSACSYNSFPHNFMGKTILIGSTYFVIRFFGDTTWIKYSPVPINIACDRQNNLLVLTDDTLMKYNKQGSLLWKISVANNPNTKRMVVDKMNNIFLIKATTGNTITTKYNHLGILQFVSNISTPSIFGWYSLFSSPDNYGGFYQQDSSTVKHLNTLGVVDWSVAVPQQSLVQIIKKTGELMVSKYGGAMVPKYKYNRFGALTQTYNFLPDAQANFLVSSDGSKMYETYLTNWYPDMYSLENYNYVAEYDATGTYLGGAKQMRNLNAGMSNDVYMRMWNNDILYYRLSKGHVHGGFNDDYSGGVFVGDTTVKMYAPTAIYDTVQIGNQVSLLNRSTGITFNAIWTVRPNETRPKINWNYQPYLQIFYATLTDTIVHLKLTVSNPYGSSDTTRTLSYKPLSFNLQGNNITLCKPTDKVVLKSGFQPSNTQNIWWNNGSTADSIVVMASQAGTYWALVKTIDGVYYRSRGVVVVADTLPPPTLFQVGNTLIANTPDVSHWLLNGQIIPFINNIDTLYMQSSGNYSFVGIKSNGCTDTSDVLPCFLVGVVDINNNANFGVSPNPCQNLLGIYLDKKPIQQNATINIYDAIGNLAQTGYITAQNQQINVEKLRQGIYFAKIHIDNQLLNAKMVKFTKL